MGQQQIFLLIVVFIAVTIAVIVALNMGGKVQVQFMEDEYSQIMMETADQFRATYEKPELFGGGAHNWDKVNFSNVPCTFGQTQNNASNTCRKEDGTFIVVITGHGDHLALNGVARIGGNDRDHIYTRQIVVYADSIKFSTDWIGHK